VDSKRKGNDYHRCHILWKYENLPKNRLAFRLLDDLTNSASIVPLGERRFNKKP
jgi:hypothetical protein